MDGKANKRLWLLIFAFITIEFLLVVRFNVRHLGKLFSNQSPEFNIWWWLVAFQAGFWAYCFYTVIVWWLHLRKKKYRLGGVLIIRRLLLGFVIFGSTIPDLPRPSDFGLGSEYEFLGLKGLAFLGFVTAAFAVQGIWVTETVLLSGQSDEGFNVAEYVRLRDCLDRFLLVAGAILGIATISVATFRNFIGAVGNPKSFTGGYVVLFGGLYSVLLALAYAPAYLAFHGRGTAIRDSLLHDWEGKISAGGLHSVEDWAAHKAKLDNILRLRFRDWASLGPGLSILAPLVVSVVSRILGGKN